MKLSKQQTTYHLFKTTFFGAVVIFVVLFSFSLQGVFAASAPNIISYQGRLLNSNGVPVSDSSASMEFRFFTAVSGGTCLWSNSSTTCDGNTPSATTSRTITLTDGLFSEDLGDTGASTPYAAIADSVFGQNTNVYLEVEIAGETLTPRKHIVAAP